MIENREEGSGGFVQDSFKTTCGKNAARSIRPTQAVNNAFIGFRQADNISKAYFARRHSQSEPPAETSSGREKTMLTKRLNNFDQMIA
jgi:hypothetical protein